MGILDGYVLTDGDRFDLKSQVGGKTVWDESPISDIKFTPTKINVVGKDLVTGSFEIDPTILEDAIKWRKYSTEPPTVVADPDYADHWHSEDLPTEPGVYLGAYLYPEGAMVPVNNQLVEYIVQIKGEAPFLDIAMWQIGDEFASVNVTPEQVRHRINSGYTRIK